MLRSRTIPGRCVAVGCDRFAQSHGRSCPLVLPRRTQWAPAPDQPITTPIPGCQIAPTTPKDAGRSPRFDIRDSGVVAVTHIQAAGQLAERRLLAMASIWALVS